MNRVFRDQRTALRNIAPETLLIQMYSLMVALAFGLAAVILWGGNTRFSDDSFRGPRNLVAWLPVAANVTWGILFLALGFSLIYGIGKQTAKYTLRFGGVVYVFLVISFIESVFQSPAVSVAQVIAFLVFAGAHFLLSVHVDTYGWR